MNKLDTIVNTLAFNADMALDDKLTKSIAAQNAKQQLKDLMLALVGDNPRGDHEIAEGVRQYQEELRRKINEL